MKASEPQGVSASPSVIAWAAVIGGGALPLIIWREMGHGRTSWLAPVQCVGLVLIALLVRSWPQTRRLTRFLLALAALRFGWACVAPWIWETDLVRAWLEHADWGQTLLFSRTSVMAGALLMSLTLIGSGLTVRDLFLCPGHIAAPAQPIPFLGLRRSVSWVVLGPALLVIFGIALPVYLYFTVHPDIAGRGRLLYFLPWILLAAVLNAANEEFQFRNVFLAHLGNVVSRSEAMLLTAVLFGLGHYYGQPSGSIGVVMAGFAGWIWAKSMVETRGFFWAFFIHLVQDIVIFSFLAIGAAK